jgi:hypothetical protein
MATAVDVCDDAPTKEDRRIVTTERGKTTPSTAASLTLAGLVAVGALLTAAPAMAEPEPIIPGQPVVSAEGPAVPPAPPPPDGRPMVPQIANPQYGSGTYGSGPIGSLRELWNLGKNPYMGMDPAASPAGAPPPGAGPAPPLPPGFVSTNAPGSETASTAAPPNSGGPPLPPGYHLITGPPPPGYEYISPNAPAAPAPGITPPAG